MAQVEDNGFGRRLQRLYDEAKQVNPKLKQQEFADKCGMSRSAFKSYLESVHDPSGTIIRSVAQACNVSADWLLGLSKTRDRNKAYETAYKELHFSEKTIKALSQISKSIYQESYDYFFSCEFSQLEMLFHYLKKYVDLEKPHYFDEGTMPKESDKHIEPGSHERVNSDTIMINESDLEQLYLSNATREFHNVLERHSGIDFFTEEEINEARDSIQRISIEENQQEF